MHIHIYILNIKKILILKLIVKVLIEENKRYNQALKSRLRVWKTNITQENSNKSKKKKTNEKVTCKHR